VNLGLTLLLVRRFGIVGAALGTLVAVTMSNVFVQMPAACRLLGVPIGKPSSVRWPCRRWSRRVPAALVAWTLQVSVEAASVLDVIGRGAVVGLVYLLAFVSVGLGRTERARYLGSVRSVTSAALRAREAV
jgi:hypothetical protein